PSNLAMAIAAQKPGDPKFQSRLSGVTDGASSYKRAFANSQGRNARMTGGSGFFKQTKSETERPDFNKLFNQKKGAKAESTTTTHVIGLAEKARETAAINNLP